MKPTEHKNPFYGVQAEIIHAMSSLNMVPEKVENPDPEACYLSELDVWAQHSMEHLHAAIDNCSKVFEARSAIQRVLVACFRLLHEGDTETVKYILGELALAEIFYH